MNRMQILFNLLAYIGRLGYKVRLIFSTFVREFPCHEFARSPEKDL